MKNKFIGTALASALVISSGAAMAAYTSDDCNDESLLRRVDRIVDMHPSIDDDVHIEVNKCYVTLSGDVDSKYEKDLAQRLVSEAYGVKGLNNRIRIEEDNFINSEYEMTSVEANASIKSDYKIKRDIRNKFWMSFKLDSGDIEINVRDAKATLNGVVDSYDEKRLAEQKALKAGAVEVINNLSVS